MALPKEIKIQYSKGMFIIYFWRKDNHKDSCGYMEDSITKLRKLKLEQLDKFKVTPKRWDELEQVLLKKVEVI